MIHSSSEATSNSPTPISPFSTYSRLSEATSDEAPDLGAFNTVFRELQQLQIGPPRILHTTLPALALHADHDERELELESASPRSALLSAPPTDSEANAGSTVWTQGIIASYFDPSVASAQTRSTVDDRSRATDSTTDEEDAHVHIATPSLSEDAEAAFVGDGSDSDTEGEVDPLAFTIVGSLASDTISLDQDGIVDDPEHPTLGTIDSVIEFLMSERDRVQAGRLTERRIVQHYSSTSDGGGVRQIQDSDARRAKKRRRKKPIQTIQILKRGVNAPEMVPEVTVHADDASGDADRDDMDMDPDAKVDGYSSSSFDSAHHHYKSSPSTPPLTNRVLIKRDALKHSKSTPTLHVKTIPPDPQILKLRCLAHKLRLKFPEDYEHLTALLTQDFSGEESDFSDPRGPAPRASDTLIHVFIDHSNILIGLLTYHKKHRSLPRRPKRLSHAALALLLERGRPITRRCLVTSSPLYQPMESAIQLGYDVRIYARVPDNGNAPDRRHGHPPDTAASRSANWRKSETVSSSLLSSSKAHVPGHSGGNTSTDSDRATGNGNGSGSGGAMRAVSGPSGTTITRIRYREQGVDELLQLKLHQAIAAADPPPPNATIVLATGDGNVGQFNEEGFLGPVRLALQRGWKIELYAWEEGLSRTWKKTFSDGPWKERFRIVKMEDFADDLLQVEREGM